jgi:hypothetical protein
MNQGGWRGVLRAVERDGIRCGAPVLLAGFVAGAGLEEVAAGPLGLASRTICELVILLVLQVAGPVLVVLLALVQLGPLWLEQVQALGPRAWRVAVPAAAILAPLLLTRFLVASLVSGAMVTPRAELGGEVGDVLSGLQLRDLVITWIRASVFFAVVCAWCLRQCERGLLRQLPPGVIVSELFSHGFVVILLLKLVWIVAVDPFGLD